MLRVQNRMPSIYEIDDYNGGASGIGGTTSHGLQFNKLFVGLGAGYYYTAPQHNIPIFADARWDFFGTRGVNFFAGIKLGYRIGLDVDSFMRSTTIIDPANEKDGKYPGEVNPSSFYFQPSVGIRIRTGHSHGLNISLNYIPVHQQIREYNSEDYGTGHYRSTPIDSYTKGYIALGLGFDF